MTTIRELWERYNMQDHGMPVCPPEPDVERIETLRGHIAIWTFASDPEPEWFAYGLDGYEVASGVAGSRAYAITEANKALIRAATGGEPDFDFEPEIISPAGELPTANFDWSTYQPESPAERAYADYKRRFRSARKWVHSFFAIECDPHFSWAPCDICDRPSSGDRWTCEWYAPADAEHPKPTNQPAEVCCDCIYYQEYGRLDDATMLEIEGQS